MCVKLFIDIDVYLILSFSTATFKINLHFCQKSPRKSNKSINQLNCRQFGNVFKATLNDSRRFKNTIATDKRDVAEKEADREKISIFQLHDFGFRLLFSTQGKI